ncbi:MAG: ABC transporter ATP-binding protein [Acidimicrobiales bacterium]|nr:ABC transporter ATP-binding protein [Acidimicrobiales bacterium]
MLQVDRLDKRYSREPRLVRRHGLTDIATALVPRAPVPAKLRDDEFWALRDISFDVGEGEAVGVIGRNGSGKTTLLRTIQGLTPPDGGQVTRRRSTAALIDIGTGFDPSASGREAIVIEGTLLGMGAEEIRSVEQQIIDFSELEEVIEAPLSTYSSGMLLRLGYSIIVHLNPGLLLIDEVLAVGDPGFQRKCVTFLMDYKRAGGSLVLVSHDLWQIRSLCDRCLVLEEGREVAFGAPTEAIDQYIDLVEGTKADESNDSVGAIGLSHPADREDATGPESLRIDQVRLTAPDGQAIRSGGSANIDVVVTNANAPASLLCTIAIDAEDSSARVLEVSPGRPTAFATGSTHIRCSLDELPLVARSFRLVIELRNGDAGPSGEIRTSHQERVVIANHATMDQTPHLILGSLGHLDAEWRML